jgi:putative transposase
LARVVLLARAMSRPRRLPGISYTGAASYFVTAVTRERRKAFRDIEFGVEAAAALLATADRFAFDVPAYCLMPDHTHMLVTARTDDSSLCDLVGLWKQATGYRWHLRRGGRLWQAGYFERVLRADEPTLAVARYIVENPVRAGLVTCAGDYPLTGSSCYSIAQIIDAVQIELGRRLRPEQL